MTTDRITLLLSWLAATLYLGVAIALAGIAPAASAPAADLAAFDTLVNDPNMWSFIAWESIFILAGLTVRAIVIRLTEPSL